MTTLNVQQFKDELVFEIHTYCVLKAKRQNIACDCNITPLGFFKLVQEKLNDSYFEGLEPIDLARICDWYNEIYENPEIDTETTI